MGVATNGITHPAPDGQTLLSEYINDPDLGIQGHKQYAAIIDGRPGQYGKVGVLNNAMMVTLDTALGVDKDAILSYDRGSNYLNGLSTSAVIMSSAGKLKGLEMNYTPNTGSITVRLYANTAASGTILVDTFTPATGYSYRAYPGRRTQSGIYALITITGNATLSYTVDFDPTAY